MASSTTVDPSRWVEDMTCLPELSESSVLDNIKKRFQDGLIYTYTGSILVAVNPYKNLDIFGHGTIAKYENQERQKNSPHIFALSDAAISSIRTERKNQSVIISGESGSGKSESTKYILSYLTAVTSHHSNTSWIHQQILEANTVLESFGNAKTSRNNNSSRFGKFIQVQLDRKLQIIGANITSYLLEKSRVARQSKSERNYHVFYELVQGANEDEIKDFLLQSAEAFNYLSQSGCTSIPGVDSRSKFEGLKFSLTVLNITSDQTNCIFKLLSAILWLGNVSFKAQAGNESVTIEDKSVLRNVATLLGVDEANLNKVLCFKKLVVRTETTMVPLKPIQATDNRDSIAKNLYSNLFRVLLELINATLQAGPDNDAQNSIGVLDIFGFEDFAVNSFEQFCINYTNEKLQNFFNQFIFKLEQEEYEKEGINWEKISFEDNQLCIDLIEAKTTGILAQLDEEVKLPKGSEESWMIKLEKTHDKHKHFTKPKLKSNVFGIKHYAGDVLYTVDGFLEKNKDALQDELYDLISNSSYPFIASIIIPKDNDVYCGGSSPGTPRNEPVLSKGSPANSMQALNQPFINSNVPAPKMTPKTVSKMTAGGTFKNQLNSLVMTLGATSTHYVRCIKPNSTMEAFTFDEPKVLCQLRYSGMMETIKIRKAGFPARVPYEKFNIENRFILPPDAKLTSDPKEKAKRIASACNLPDGTWQTGRTKIFMKAEIVAEIQKRTNEIQKSSVLTIQRYVRGHQTRAKYQNLRKNAIIIQKYIKGYLYVVRYRRQKRAVLKMQSVARGWQARKLHRELKEEKAKALKAEEERKERELRELRALEAAEMERQATERIMAELRTAQLKLQEAQQIQQEEERKRREEASEAEKVEQQARIQREAAAMATLDTLIGKVEPEPETRQSRTVNSDTDSLSPEPTPLAKKANADNKLDEIFSFIKDFRSHDELAALAQNLTSEINELYEKKKVLLSNENRADARISTLTDEAADIDDQSSTRKSQINPPESSKRVSSISKKKGLISTLGMKATGVGSLQDTSSTLRYQKTALSTPITRLVEGDPSYALAIECSKLLTRALDPALKKQEEICTAMHQIVHMGLTNVNLRDEVFVQIIKQITVPLDGEPKGWNEITLNGWQLLTLCIGTFPPSKLFSKFLLAFILRGCKTNASTKRMVSLTAELFSKSILIHGARKFAPTIPDIQSFRDGVVNKLCKIYVMDGHSFDILISPVTTADEVVKEISKKFKLKDTASWSLYTVTQKESKAIRSVEYLADCMLVMQKESKKPTSTNTLKANKTKECPATPGSTDLNINYYADAVFDTDEDFKLTLKKRIFKNPKEDLRTKDETEIHLLCCQADHEVNTDFYPIGLREGVKLAALKAHIMLGDYNPNSTQLPHATTILQWITPRVISKASKENVAKMVIEEYAKLKGKSPVDAKLEYLNIVKALRFYGAALFEIESPGDLAFNEPIDIAISVTGVQLIQAVSREIAMIFAAEEIKDVQLDERTISIVIGKHSDSLTEVYEFTSDRSEEMASLIRDYCGIRVIAVKERVYSENDVANLKKGIEIARTNLIDNECVRTPGPDSFAAEFIPSTTTPGSPKTIRGSLIMPKSLMSMKSAGSTSRSASPTTNRKKSGFGVFTKSDAPDDLVADYSEADWVFSTTKLVASILAPQHEASDFAMNLNIFILEYIGLAKGVEVPNRLSKLTAPVAAYIQRMQRLFEQCLEKPVLSNELYLQIIKMTNSDKVSYASTQMWKLMCISVGVVIPTIPEIMEYLKAHLRRCEAVDPKDKSEKERSKYANYALKTLYQTIRGGKRMYPPSTEEIGCAMKCSPMTIRFYALNRQFRALPIHPFDSIESIYCNLMDKFGLAEASGFAIYQYYAKSELALFAEDKISDVIFKCEKASFASQTSDKVHFIIKKRLFDEPLKPSDHPTEEEFVRWQVVEDIKNDRYPLKQEDLITAAAFTAQIQFGDAALGAVESYHEFSTKVIPKRLVSNDMDEKIATQH
ncbi:UNVERIFIED_CONTAM: cytochrome c oxidase subunit 1, partial [Siphonaria sp. JEL0065]